MTKELAPDLANGFILSGLKDENSWMTEIQSVLTESRDGKSISRYLAQECRSENLPFSKGYLGNTQEIFMKEKPVEFLTYTMGDRFYQLTSFDTVVPTAALGQYEKLENNGLFQLREMTGEGWKSHVECRERAASLLTFEEALSGLQERRLKIRKLFLRVNFSLAGTDWTIHCPCRYVNFSTRDVAEGDYLQPISGMVLLPGAYGGFAGGYIACASDNKSEPVIQFLQRRYGDAFDILAKRSGQPELEPVLKKFSSMISISSPIYDLVVPVRGDFQLYTYDKN